MINRLHYALEFILYCTLNIQFTQTGKKAVQKLINYTGILIFIIVYCLCPLIAQGAGNALSFDGSDDYVSVPDHSQWDFGSTDFSIEFWAKLAAIPTNNNGLVTRSVGEIGLSSFDGYALAIQANANISFLGGYPVNPSAKVNSYSDDVTDLKWHHITGVRSGNTFYTYTDGILSNTDNSWTNWNGTFNDLTQDLYIGYWNNYNYFNGQIDEVRIWSDARSAAEIQENMHNQISASESGLIAYWRFNETTGTSAADETTNDHDGSLNNMADEDWVASTAPIGGYALDFDGTNDYVDCGNNSNLNFSSEFTFEAWAKPSTTNTGWLIQKAGTDVSSYTQGDFGLEFHSNGNIQGFIYDGTTHWVSISYSSNLWYHLSIVWNGTNIYLYVNGELKDSDTGGMSNYSKNLLIGSGGYSSFGDQAFNGFIDEVRIWNDVRTPTEIQENMYKELTGNESGLVAYYKFNDGSGTTATDSKGSNNGTLNNFTGTYWVTSIAPIATTFTSGKTDLISVWSADNSNASSILTITDAVSGSNRIAFGHDNGSLSPNTSDKPGSIDRRLNRAWRIETNAGLTGDLKFDCSNLGITTGSNLRLLTDTDGTFSNASTVSG